MKIKKHFNTLFVFIIFLFATLLMNGCKVIDDGTITFEEENQSINQSINETKIDNIAIENDDAIIAFDDSSGLYKNGAMEYSWQELLSNKLIVVKNNEIRSTSNLLSGSLKIDSSITSIASYSFRRSTELRIITIPKGVKNIGENAFRNCINLEKILVDEENENYTSVKGVLYTKDQSILIRYPSATSASRYILPKAVKTIAYGAFNSSENLVEIVIKEGLKKIDEYAFENCTKLETINLPDSLRIIENGAFAHCRSLKTITIPKDVYMIFVPFYDCTSLESILVDEDNKNYTSIDGVLFKKENGSLLLEKYPIAKKGSSYTVPSGVKSIIWYAFSYNEYLTNVTFNEELESIGNYAFEKCINLKSAILPNTLLSLGIGAFINCTGLKTVMLGNNITLLSQNAFRNCENLEEIIIPSSIRIMSPYVFYDCNKLSKVKIDVESFINYDSEYSYGSIIRSANTVYIKEGINANGNYLINNFTLKPTSDEIGYKMYTRK